MTKINLKIKEQRFIRPNKPMEFLKIKLNRALKYGLNQYKIQLILKVGKICWSLHYTSLLLLINFKVFLNESYYKIRTLNIQDVEGGRGGGTQSFVVRLY